MRDMKTKKQSEHTGDLPKLSAPAQRALAAAGIERLVQLTQFSEAQVKQWHGIGPNALNALSDALKARGFSFANKET